MNSRRLTFQEDWPKKVTFRRLTQEYIKWISVEQKMIARAEYAHDTSGSVSLHTTRQGPQLNG
jgi:desulfoferrodoxin (superoxide reductase-like protein)